MGYTMHELRFYWLVPQYNYSVHGQGQNNEQKPTTKKFVGFHNHSPPSTMAFWVVHGASG